MSHRYLRCPACGKLSAPVNFTRHHWLEALVQGKALGRGRGWAWGPGEPLTTAEETLLRRAIAAAGARLLGKPGGGGR